MPKTGPKIGPKNGTQNGATNCNTICFFQNSVPAFAQVLSWRRARPAKVLAWLQWAKACRTTLAEKAPLLVNLDKLLSSTTAAKAARAYLSGGDPCHQALVRL